MNSTGSIKSAPMKIGNAAVFSSNVPSAFLTGPMISSDNCPWQNVGVNLLTCCLLKIKMHACFLSRAGIGGVGVLAFDVGFFLVFDFWILDLRYFFGIIHLHGTFWLALNGKTWT